MMGSYSPLMQPRHLKKCSSDFHDQVSDVLYGEEYKQRASTAEGDDLVKLVDSVDTVRYRASLPPSPLKPP